MSSRSPREVARTLAGRLPHPARRRLTLALHGSPLGRRIGRDAPFVSAVVAATDRQAPYLAECLDSIRSQTRAALEVVVVPYGDAAGCVAVAEGHAAADWRFALASAEQSYAAALNAGARRAKGEYLTFVGAADTLPADAFEVLTGTLHASGSDFVVGNVADAAPAKHLTRSEHARAHERDRIAVTLVDAPDARTDALEGNRLFRRAFWTGAQLSFPEAPGPASLPIERAYARAHSFDLLRRVTYHWTRRGDGAPFGYLQPASPGLALWRSEQRRVLDEPVGPGSDAVRDAWLYGALDHGIIPYLRDVERLDDQDWALLRDAAADLWERAGDDVRARVRPESRVAAWLAAHALRSHLTDYVAQRWFEDGQFATTVRDGTVYAMLPYAGAGDRIDVPTSCYALTERETRPVVSVQRINWTDDALRIDLFCYITNVSMRERPPGVSAVLRSDDGDALPMEVGVGADPAVTRHAAQPYQNYDHGAVTATLPAGSVVDAGPGEWRLEVTVEADGVRRTSGATQLGWQGSAAALRTREHDGHLVRPRWDDGLVLQVTAAAADASGSSGGGAPRFTIDEVILHGTTIDVLGTWSSEPPPGWVLRLEAGDLRLDGTLCSAQGDRQQVRVGAVSDPWSTGARPAPPGNYHVHCIVGDAGGEHGFPVDYADALLDRLPYDELGDVYRMRPRRSPQGRPVIELGVPLGPDEQGPFAQRRLQCEYAAEHDIAENTVYLQSYVGQSATDSPLAIHEVLRERRPELKLYWGIANHSQWVPDGATPVLMRSSQWYDVLATAQYVVSNIDFERWFVHREGQQVLQTYHGAPSKTMGVGLWREKRFTPRRIEQQLARTSYVWDALLSPAPEMSRYYREAFRYRGTILDRGYPRDDVLASPETAGPIRDAVRRRLGIGAGQTAVLYAPTWRDDVATGYRSAPLVRHLDVEAASRRLGDGFVLLLRGHRFHASPDGLGGNVVDVTAYPEINDLILASDAAVLDYSSLRFDYAVTRKPMVFLVPDLDDYTGGVRGFLYDFRGTAPGPLVSGTDEVVAQLRRLDELGTEYGDAYDEFNATYNRWQDGHAAARVVDAFFQPR